MTAPTEAQVRRAALDVYTPAGVDLFMTSSHLRAFDGRTPVDLCRTGEGQVVLDLLDALASGNLA